MVAYLQQVDIRECEFRTPVRKDWISSSISSESRVRVKGSTPSIDYLSDIADMRLP